MDDYLVIYTAAGDVEEEELFNNIKAAFESISPKLTLTEKQHQSGVLAFLDLELTFKQDHMCWQFAPKCKKELVPFNSAHFKLVKRSIASEYINSALNKSCPHKMVEAVMTQNDLLCREGYTQQLIASVERNLIETFKGLVSPVHLTNHESQLSFRIFRGWGTISIKRLRKNTMSLLSFQPQINCYVYSRG